MNADKTIVAKNLAAAIALAIMAVFAAGKGLALVSGAPALDRPHPFLPGSYGQVTRFALVLEIMCLAVWPVFGGRRFLQVCGGLGIIFIGFHSIFEILGSRDTCSCLGQLVSWSEWVRRNEKLLAIVNALSLVLLSVFGLCRRHQVPMSTQFVNPYQQTANGVLVGVCLWWSLAGTVAFLGRKVVLGGDEGMEMAKALLAFERPALLYQMWNDQPLLSTVLIGWLWHVTGVSLDTVRAFVVMLGALVPVTFWLTLRRDGLSVATVFAVLLLFMHPELPALTAAAMLEMQSYSIGLAAAIPLLIGKTTSRKVILSGIIAAVALHFKLTAAFALIVPVVCLFQTRPSRSGMLWILSVTICWYVGMSITPGTHMNEVIGSHLLAVNADAKAEMNQNAFDAGSALLGNPIIFWLAMFCSIRRLVRGEHKILAPWLIALGVAVIIHACHVPWWWYYTLHIVIPLSFLAGLGALDVICILRRRMVHLDQTCRLPLAITAITVTVLLLSMWSRVDGVLMKIRNAETLQNPVVEVLRRYAPSSQWAFTRDPMQGFIAGLVAPPELVVMPRKRFWSGQMTREYVLNVWQKYQPEQIAIDNGEHTKLAGWASFVTNYTLAFIEGRTEIYVRNDLHAPAADNSAATSVLKRMGL